MTIADVASVIAALGSLGAVCVGVYSIKRSGAQAQELETIKWRRERLTPLVEMVSEGWDQLAREDTPSRDYQAEIDALFAIERLSSFSLARWSFLLAMEWKHSVAMKEDNVAARTQFIYLGDIHECWKAAVKAELGIRSH